MGGDARRTYICVMATNDGSPDNNECEGENYDLRPFLPHTSERNGDDLHSRRRPFECIIGGKMYRIGDSTLLASYTRPYEMYGDAWPDEDLYRSASGRLFLRTVDGPESIHRIGGVGGGQLLPLDNVDAKRWLEFRGLIAEYVTIFGGAGGSITLYA